MKYNISITISRLLLAGSFCIFAGNGFAQSTTGYGKSADKFYDEQDYYSAAIYYEKYLGVSDKSGKAGFKPYTIQTSGSGNSKVKQTTKEEALYRLAESYRQLNDYANAEKWYKEALKLDANDYPHTRYWYAVSLRANGNHIEAEKQLQLFLNGYKKGDELKRRATLELANCKYIAEQLSKKGPKRFEISKANNNINQANANYASAIAGKNLLVFTSTRADSIAAANAKTDPYLNTLYQVSLNDLSSKPEKVNVAVAADTHQGIASFTPNGSKMFFTRWAYVEGKKSASIYVSEATSGQWSEPVKLGNNINVQGYSSQQPFVSADGKFLLFASDRPGGSGGFDIWYALLDANATPSKVANIGTAINTVDNEQAPYYYQQSKTLLFASNGRVGMGGYDLYQSAGDFSQWAAPVNPGFPVNSVKDDMYYTAIGEKTVWEQGFFSSDRSTNCCLEIFSIKKIKTNKLVTGIVVDCSTQQPLASVSINVNATANNQSIKSVTTDANGCYYVEMPDYQELQLTGNKEKYNSAKLSVAKPADEESDTLMNQVICLTPVPDATTDTSTTTSVKKPMPMIVYFDFDKSTIRPDATNTFESIVQLMKKEPTLVLEIDGYTDGKGVEKYNLKLSEERANACRNYLIKAGIDASRLLIKANGECCPVEQDVLSDGNDNPAGREKNRRVEFKIVSY